MVTGIGERLVADVAWSGFVVTQLERGGAVARAKARIWWTGVLCVCSVTIHVAYDVFDPLETATRSATGPGPCTLMLEEVCGHRLSYTERRSA